MGSSCTYLSGTTCDLLNTNLVLTWYFFVLLGTYSVPIGYIIWYQFGTYSYYLVPTWYLFSTNLVLTWYYQDRYNHSNLFTLYLLRTKIYWISIVKRRNFGPHRICHQHISKYQIQRDIRFSRFFYIK